MKPKQFDAPFDTDDWRDELAAIRRREAQSFAERTFVPGSLAHQDQMDRSNLLRALDAEISDCQMYALNTATLYDEVSGGRVSYPNTVVGQVVSLYHQQLTDAYAEGAAAALSESALADALFYVYGNVTRSGASIGPDRPGPRTGARPRAFWVEDARLVLLRLSGGEGE